MNFKILITLLIIFSGSISSVCAQITTSNKPKNKKDSVFISTTDTVVTVKETINYNPAIDRNRVMLLDAILELNEALSAGVKASIDSLKRPLPSNTNPADKKTILLAEKRRREKEELLPYLEHLRDSLRDNSNKILTERKAIQIRLDPTLANSETQQDQVVEIAIEENKSETQVVSRKNISPVEKLSENLPSPTVAVVHSKPKIKSEINESHYDSAPASSLKKIVWEPARAIIDSAALAHYEAQELSQPILTERRRPIEDDTITHIKSDFFLRRAQKAISDSQFKRAGELLKKSLELWNRNYAALITLGDLEVHNGSYNSALKSYVKALNVDSSKASLSHKIGLTYLKLKKKNEAWKNFTRAIRLDPFYIPAYIDRAGLASSLHKYAEAVQDYNSVLAINLNYRQAYKERGIALLMNKKYASATDDFTRYLIFDQSDESIYYFRGLAKIGNNDWLEGCLDLSIAADMGYYNARKIMKKSCE